MTEESNELKILALNEVFSPSAPIAQKHFFSGRNPEIRNVVDAINERGQHVIVYGARGVGKTSFANVIGTDLINVVPVKITCNRYDSFKALWEKAFAKVKFERSETGVGFVPTERKEKIQLDFFIPDKPDFSALDIQLILERVKDNLLFIFDEYDSVEDEEVRDRMADTIKSLSDNAARVTVMLVGIANNVAELIGSHASIERCVRQVQLPCMTNQELDFIIERGLSHLRLSMDVRVRHQIVNLSLGFPHFTHLLAKQACKIALDNNALKVSRHHYAAGLVNSVSMVDESIRVNYQRATFATNDRSNFETVLWACAEAETDEYGTFRAKDIAQTFSSMTLKNTSSEALSYNVGKLCSPGRGSVLERIKSGSYVRFRFSNPLMRAHVRLKYKSISGRMQDEIGKGFLLD